MIGALSLWSQRRKLRSSIARDPLSAGDPAAWLDGASTVLELRTSCPEPGWLAHCAYWAGVPMERILLGALGAADTQRPHGIGAFVPLDNMFDLRKWSYPELADLVFAAEERHPAIRGIEMVLPSQVNTTLRFHLQGDQGRRFGGADKGQLTPDALCAGALVLLVASLFHRERGLRESLVLTAGAAATLLAIAQPRQRGVILEAQRIAYKWPSSMTSTSFTK